MSSQNLGVTKNVRNPGTIAVNQNHDQSRSQRSANGVPGTIKTVVSVGNTKTILLDYAMLWVVNTDTAVHYLTIAQNSGFPSPSSSNGMAIPAGQGILINCGRSTSDKDSLAFQADSATVHVTVLEA